MKEFFEKFKIVFKRVLKWEMLGLAFVIKKTWESRQKIAILFSLGILAFALGGSVRFSAINNFEIELFRALNAPLEYLYFNGSRLSFPPYFLINLALMAASGITLFSFFAAKAGSRETFVSVFIKTSAIVVVLALHCLLTGLFLAEKAFNLQIIIYFTEFIILAGFFFMRDWNRGVNVKADKYITRGEAGWLMVFTAALFILYIFDYASWKYSYVGDEYAFFKFAREIFDGGRPLKFFYEQGGYGYHPNLASIYSAFIMKLFGDGLFAWKFSSSIIPVITTPLFYIWVKLMFNKKTAAISAVVFGFSLSMLAFGKIPYDNIQAVFAFVLSMLLVEIAIRKNSSFWVLLAGVSLGLGCYTFYTARLTIIAAALYWFFHPLRKNFSLKNLTAGMAVYLGTIMFLLLDPDFLRNLFVHSTIGGSELKNPAERPFFMLMNYASTFFSFIYKAGNTHFIAGAAMDKAGAAGVVVGFTWMIFSFFRDWRARFLLVAYAVLVFFIGGIVQYKYPVNTRIIFLIPILSIIAAAGLARIAAVLPLYFKNLRKNAKWVFVFTALLVAGFNIYGFYFRMPSVYPFKMQSYLVKYMKSEAPEKTHVLVAKEHVNMGLISELYGFAEKLQKIEIAEFEDMFRSGALKGKILVLGERAARETGWPRGFRGRVKEIRDYKNEVVYYIFNI